MKPLLTLLVLPTTLLAHTGHPGPEHHGSLTHVLLGVALSFAFVFAAGLWMWKRTKKSEAVETVSRKD